MKIMQTESKPEKKLRKKAGAGSAEMERHKAGLDAIHSDYVDYVVKSFPPEAVESKTKMATQLELMQKMHARKTVMYAVNSTVADPCYGLSYSMAMYACCPWFRKELKSMYGKNRGLSDETIRNKCIDEAMGSPPGSKERKRYEKMCTSGEYGPLPMCEDTVALTRIGLARKAYEDLRKPGARSDRILQHYTEAMGMLDDRAKADGLDTGLVDSLQKSNLAMLCEKDPKYGRIFMSDDGEVVDKDNVHKQNAALFSVRGVFSKEFFSEIVRENMAGTGGLDSKDGRAVIDRMSGLYADDFGVSRKDARHALAGFANEGEPHKAGEEPAPSLNADRTSMLSGLEARLGAAVDSPDNSGPDFR